MEENANALEGRESELSSHATASVNTAGDISSLYRSVSTLIANRPPVRPYIRLLLLLSVQNIQNRWPSSRMWNRRRSDRQLQYLFIKFYLSRRMAVETTTRPTSTVRSSLFFGLCWSIKRAAIFSLDKRRPTLGNSIIGSAGLGWDKRPSSKSVKWITKEKHGQVAGTPGTWL